MHTEIAYLFRRRCQESGLALRESGALQIAAVMSAVVLRNSVAANRNSNYGSLTSADRALLHLMASISQSQV